MFQNLFQKLFRVARQSLFRYRGIMKQDSFSGNPESITVNYEQTREERKGEIQGQLVWDHRRDNSIKSVSVCIIPATFQYTCIFSLRFYIVRRQS